MKMGRSIGTPVLVVLSRKNWYWVSVSHATVPLGHARTSRDSWLTAAAGHQASTMLADIHGALLYHIGPIVRQQSRDRDVHGARTKIASIPRG